MQRGAALVVDYGAWADTVGSVSRGYEAVAGLRWARPRLSGGYGVIAMAPGPIPTLIALRAVLVAMLIGLTVPDLSLTT